MKKAGYILLFIYLVILCISSVSFAAAIHNDPQSFAQNKTGKSEDNQLIYVSPMPGAVMVTPQTNIILRSKDLLNSTSISTQSLINVNGSVSGYHSGKIILSDDQKTLMFQPDIPFSLGEKVSVILNDGLSTLAGDKIKGKTFDFTISYGGISNEFKRQLVMNEIEKESLPQTNSVNPVAPKLNSIILNKVNGTKDLPDDFPAISVTQSNNPSPGYIFLSNFSNQKNNPYRNYLMILDNSGEPVFYKKMQNNCFDFKMHPTGLMTYFDSNTQKFYGMNSSFIVVDSFTCGNGYVNDVHELLVLPNGNYWLLADDPEKVDMSQIVTGGNSNAIVTGIIIQELDKNGNVIFQWRTWDHFKITDATHEDLTAATIDYVHSNAIDIDNDGNILLSSRHIDEITKINIQTGDIIWRLGGKNNQFNFLNDNDGFSHQHAIRRLPNGDVTLFDDGNFHNPSYSRAVEYKLDEQNMTATLVWQYRNNPDIYAFAMGYVQRFNNGNTLVGWGTANTSVSEVQPDGTVALEMSLPPGQWSYRAFKFPMVFLESPNGGEKWKANTTHNITWISSGIDSINIDYSLNNGNSWTRIVSGFPADSESYQWIAPNTLSSNCRIRISNSSLNSIPYNVISDSSVVIDSSLSVEVSSFTSNIQNGFIQLNWTTSIEKNNYGFEVQRKLGVQDWQGIGFVGSIGNSFAPVNYSFSDELDTSSYVGKIYYRLKQIDLSGNSQYLKELHLDVNLIPQTYTLFNNYPNPFNPNTVIKYSLPFDSRVTIRIYNIIGQLVKELINTVQTTGDHKIIFNADELPSGVYLDVFEAKSLDGKQNSTLVKKMMLLK